MSGIFSSHRPLKPVLLATFLAAWTSGAASLKPASHAGKTSTGEERWMAAARKTAAWLERCAVKDKDGLSWPAVPSEPATGEIDLYSGNAGMVLFFLELWKATNDEHHRAVLNDAANSLLARLPRKIEESFDAGLYTGVAGVGFVLEEVYRDSHEHRFREGARRCLDAILMHQQLEGQGVHWNGVTDIISGSAGTGLFLLYCAQRMNHLKALETACRAGDRLIELGIPENGGLKWRMDAEFPRLMPNFSHGTAGVGYFLASLYLETRKQPYLDAALKAARYLISIADTSDDQCRIFHSEPDRKDLFYFGWCHGPAGTARLFLRLFEATGDQEWLSFVDACVRTLEQSGIPQQRPPGFWNNVSQCCGNAGVAEFFLRVFEWRGEERHLAFAERMAVDLLSRAQEVEDGLCWPQAEHRVRPEWVVAQTGFMQGAAGIGLLFIHLDAEADKRAPPRPFPDSPFPRQRTAIEK